ncbi:MAG: DNA (cytosine-5-)-methyltransferase [Propionibacteriaceae bacterium]|nr:DNA (cytosine-5-)-methyltransferase [Propionibacteriaceae bacterium]
MTAATPVATYRISDAATALQVSVDTIRRWEKLGLIKAVRDGHNHRIFDIDELRRVQQKTCGNHQENNFKILKSDLSYPVTCIDLFAGAGGTALGFHNAGISHTLLSEINKDASATLRENSRKMKLEWNVIEGDVAEIDFSGMQADVIQAGFPCQAFSYAGKSMGFEDTRGTLFFEFARAIKEVRPKIAIGENVRGLLSHDDGRTLQTMLNVLNDLGYSTSYKLLKAQYLDVPQKRERLILFAVRNDLTIPAVFPKEKNYFISLREALVGCPESTGHKYTERKHRIMELIPEGGYWRDLPVELQREYMGASFHLGGGKTGMARRLSWDQPSLTLTCNPAQKQTERCHPGETRPLNIREYARIQTFPDEWVFTGSTGSQYKQIGNAVPVNLGYHIGRCVLAALGHIKADDTMDIIDMLERK